jgi:hypothetical protein
MKHGFAELELKMKIFLNINLLILLTLYTFTGYAIESIKLTDVIKSNGTGNIDLLKDVTASQLEEYRVDNNGKIVLGVDVNEDSSGTEKASSQAVAIKSVAMTVTFANGYQIVYDSYDSTNDCCSTETIALLAENPDTVREPYYTLLGESGSARISSANAIQDEFDSTLQITVPDKLFNGDNGTIIEAVVDIVLLDTNTSLGDPEAFYDYSNGFEDLAILNAQDALFIDDYAAGRDEAPALILTNPPPTTDPLSVSTWNYFPSAESFYIVGYEDLYPQIGDYDFNDLTVAYRVRYGFNTDNQVVSIKGIAYLLTRGAAYNHNWHLKISLPQTVLASLSCVTYIDPQTSQTCSPDNPPSYQGIADIVLFDKTLQIFTDPLSSSPLVNTLPGQSFILGPKATFTLELDTPIPSESIGSAPFDPVLEVLNTGESIQLLQVDPDFKDLNGYPFGMLLPNAWQPPYEYIDLNDAYPLFQSFVDSEGTQSLDWYNTFEPSNVVEIPPRDVWAW